MVCQHEERDPKPVASLKVWSRETVNASFQETDQAMEIYPRDDFYFGRNPSCKYNCADRTISNKHVHIHCIVYEEDETSGIPPLVYVEDLSTNGTFLTRATQTYERRLTRGQNGTVLLCDGDQLRVSSLMFFYFVSHSLPPPQDKAIGLNELQSRECQLFIDRFEITNRVLGLGGYGSVFAAIHKKSHRQLACKVVDVDVCVSTKSKKKKLKDVNSSGSEDLAGYTTHAKSRMSRSSKNRQLKIRDEPQFREFEILKDLDHPNIIKLEKVFWSVNTLYIFQELVTGGDLFSFIESKGGSLSDIEAAVILRQILKAIEYLHDRDIVHRDLKPDNILVTSAAEGARIVVTDFGNARYLPENAAELHDLPARKRRMFTVAGTLEYVAPEVHSLNPMVLKDEGYTKAVDMWSIGSITAALLTGDVIFADRVDPRFRDDPHLMIALAARCDLSVMDSPHSMWQKVGKKPKDFVKKLLVLDETKRMTATQALAHDWFTNKYYADELDAVYQRSIEGWVPRRKVFRLVEALDLSGLPPHESMAESSTSCYFPSEAQAPSQLSSTGWFKTGRKIPPAALPRIEELDEGSEHIADEQMTQDFDTPDSAIPDSFDVQESMSQLAINLSEASTDLLGEDEELTGDVTFDADHEMSVSCLEDDYIGPILAQSSLEKSSPDATKVPQRNIRKRQFSPRPDHVSMAAVESVNEEGYHRHGTAKRLRSD
ncbi:hypothetical protein FKW77_006009 [Venturia effusa]|uniref:Uncharacterized protein n=1 Tax=Venturia effusa TaxID=50376 RepID=A0A517L3E2_9PEZI|nr:hypothetical protein FKW77_006009 [Venturia effusa]